MGLAYAVASEDMDVMAHGANQIRGFNGRGKEGVVFIDHKCVLETLNLSQEEFVDLCILCGCDYTTNIQGMGPMTAYKYLSENKNIEGVIRRIEIDNLKKKKSLIISDNFEYQKARQMFLQPNVISNK